MKNIASKDFAELFLGKSEDVIPEVFKFFIKDCIDFCKVNPNELDGLINDFNENKSVRSLTAIIELLRSAEEYPEHDGKALAEKTVKYIEEHLFEDFSVEQIAKELNISFYYMCHLFKEYKGCTVNSFKQKKRMQRAERLLCETDKKITDIALECGYDNVSYFTEIFTRYAESSPTKFRSKMKGERQYFPFYTDEDVCLANRLVSHKLLSDDIKTVNKSVNIYDVHMPDEEYGFLHEAAIIEYHGVLFASWYNCPELELKGRTPIRGRRSHDGGKTWSDVEVIEDDPSGKIMFCPPVYGIDNDKLYMFVNEMTAPDHIHALNLYAFDEKTDKFIKLWSRPIPFKLNTNVMKLPNGKLMLSGRVGELERFPNTPAVMISDSGRIDAEWRLIKIAQNGDLPDGESLVHPEICPIIEKDKIYMFCRNDRRRVPLIYVSSDMGESWSEQQTHNIPFIRSKIYSGKLSDGRNYVVGNIDKPNRSKLAVYFSKPDTIDFDECVIIKETDGNAVHYPVAYESNKKLYIIYTLNFTWDKRGAEIAVIDLG